MLGWQRSFPSIPTWNAWLLLWAQHTVHVFHTACSCSTHARHGEMYFLNADTHVCFSPSFPYFSGLVLRTTLCSDIGMFSGSLNSCTLLREPLMLERHPEQMPGGGCRGDRGAKSKAVICRAGLWPEARGSISRAHQCPSLSRHCSFCPSLSPKERVKMRVREQNCSCLQDRFGSSACLTFTFPSHFQLHPFEPCAPLLSIGYLTDSTILTHSSSPLTK